jgi:beta-mannosidase
VAQALRDAGHWSLDGPSRRFDAEDWWYRLRFDAAPTSAHEPLGLGFDGLAGLCEAWLNGTRLLSSENMHLAHECADIALRPTGNELLLRFRSLDHWLAQRRPRPRWRAPMVEHQQLRWARASLLGRTPGWSPPAAAVGPWREVWWERRTELDVTQLRLTSRVEETTGVITLSVELRALRSAASIRDARLELVRDSTTHCATLAANAPQDQRYDTRLVVPEAALWWPHTHGEPVLYEARIVVQMDGGAEPVVIDLGSLGFRTLALDTQGGDFALRVNDVPVFCRGACWMPLDVVSLNASPAACRTALEQVRAAGMNMVRISGTAVYESDAFFDACDALGILVWQDFMFANLDYPHDDPTFAASARAEAEQQLQRWQARPSLAVLCGNSECEQQAAMWGSPREAWASPLFHGELATLSEDWCPDVPYWPSSAHGGAFPHQNNAGTTSYYGVGAYLRPLEDARRCELRFATECLAFANVPSASTLARMPGGEALRVHHPGWKARSPRDLGAGWDFDDVRDHYLRLLYRVEPVALRYADHAHYLALSRAVSAEVMAASFAEWRRAGSPCRGALVWFLRDLWAGAGWGLIDDRGVPKSAYHGCKQALAPVAAFISDEGTNGLDVHVVNEPDRALDATLDVRLYRDDDLLIAQASRPLHVAARATLREPLAAWFDDFVDLNHAYRFGPAAYAMVVATLRGGDGERLAQAFHFPEGLPSQRLRDIGLAARAQMNDDGSAELTVTTRGFAQSISVDVPGFVAQDEYFHLEPGGTRTLRLVPQSARAVPALRGSVSALNAWTAASLKVGNERVAS